MLRKIEQIHEIKLSENESLRFQILEVNGDRVGDIRIFYSDKASRKGVCVPAKLLSELATGCKRLQIFGQYQEFPENLRGPKVFQLAKYN